MIPTRAECFVLLPGTDVPDEWLPPQACGCTEENEGRAGPDLTGDWQRDVGFYPAHTHSLSITADHHAVMPRLKGGREESPPISKTLNPAELEQEEWRERDEWMLSYLKKHKEQVNTAARGGNPTNLLDIITQGNKNSFRDHYSSRGGSRKAGGPFASFCEKRQSNPNYPLLIRAGVEGNELFKSQLMDEMAREGWRQYLSQVRPPTASATFAYLAKCEGRKPRAEHYSCEEQIEDATGTLRLLGAEKCALLADSSEDRFATPEVLARVKPRPSAALTPSGPFRHPRQGGRMKFGLVLPQAGRPPPTLLRSGPVSGCFQFFRQEGVSKAFASWPPKKAPGPYGLKSEFLRGLPSLLAPVTSSLNIILQTGRFPPPTLKLFVILSDKPRRPKKQRRATRPISLISVLSEALETVVYNRLMCKFEGSLIDSQYAYRRARGTEHHLLDLANERKGYVYLHRFH